LEGERRRPSFSGGVPTGPGEMAAGVPRQRGFTSVGGSPKSMWLG
jgi:hypothetical protein